MTEYRPLNRLYFLDSLRGLAAIYVILFHALTVTHRPLHLAPGLQQFASFGGTGVFLFFVISGLSLTMTMPRHIATGRPLVSYALSRLFRIAPLFYAVLGYMVLRSTLHGWGLPIKTILLNAIFMFNLVPGKQEGLVGASWTIGVEMLFYAVFPVIYALRLPTQLALAACTQALFVVMLFTIPTHYTYWTIVGWLPQFLVGMWSFRALKMLGGHVADKKRFAAVMIAAGATLLLTSAAFKGGDIVALRLPIALGYAGIAIGLGLQRPGALGNAVLRFFGRISYSTYLLHAAILFALDDWMIAYTAGWNDNWAYVLRAAVVLGLVIPAAYLTNVLIEGPMERVGRRLFSALPTRPPPLLAARSSQPET